MMIFRYDELSLTCDSALNEHVIIGIILNNMKLARDLNWLRNSP